MIAYQLGWHRNIDNLYSINFYKKTFYCTYMYLTTNDYYILTVHVLSSINKVNLHQYYKRLYIK